MNPTLDTLYVICTLQTSLHIYGFLSQGKSNTTYVIETVFMYLLGLLCVKKNLAILIFIYRKARCPNPMELEFLELLKNQISCIVILQILPIYFGVAELE